MYEWFEWMRCQIWLSKFKLLYKALNCCCCCCCLVMWQDMLVVFILGQSTYARHNSHKLKTFTQFIRLLVLFNFLFSTKKLTCWRQQIQQSQYNGTVQFYTAWICIMMFFSIWSCVAIVSCHQKLLTDWHYLFKIQNSNDD